MFSFFTHAYSEILEEVRCEYEEVEKFCFVDCREGHDKDLKKKTQKFTYHYKQGISYKAKNV